MSRINFNGCVTISDIPKNHAGELMGAMLVETVSADSSNEVIGSKRSLIFGAYVTSRSVVFEVEENVDERVSVFFNPELLVVTSVLEAGDVYWFPDKDFRRQLTIDDLSPEDMDFDGMLREAIDLSRF